jgi:hypothetical protein
LIRLEATHFFAKRHFTAADPLDHSVQEFSASSTSRKVGRFEVVSSTKHYLRWAMRYGMKALPLTGRQTAFAINQGDERTLMPEISRKTMARQVANFN